MDIFNLETQELSILSMFVAEELAKGLTIKEIGVLTNFIYLIATNLSTYAVVEPVRSDCKEKAEKN